MRALKKLVAQFQAQPNVQVAVVPFETNVKNVWPPTVTDQRFARPDSTIDDLHQPACRSQLGKGTDYQGALAYAYSLIAGDISDASKNNPAAAPAHPLRGGVPHGRHAVPALRRQ